MVGFPKELRLDSGMSRVGVNHLCLFVACMDEEDYIPGSKRSEAMNFPTSKMVHLRDATLCPRGREAGRLIVLCHGWPEQAFSYRHQIPRWSMLDTIALFLIRRYGASSRPAAVAEYDIHALTGDLIALLDAFDYEDAIFVGHDWGAIVVWNLALLHLRSGQGHCQSVCALQSARSPIPSLFGRSSWGTISILFTSTENPVSQRR